MTTFAAYLLRLSLLFILSGTSTVLAQTVAPSHPGDSADGAFAANRGTTVDKGTAITNLDSGLSFASIQAAIDAANPGEILEVQVLAHSEGQVVVSKNLTLQGATGAEVISMAEDTGASGDDRAWFLVDTGVDLTVRDLTFDGNGFLVYQAFRHKGTGSFDRCHFRDIQYNPTGPNFAGVGVVAFGGRVDVRDSTFEQMGRTGVLAFGSGVNGSVIEGNSYTGKGAGDWLDYGFEVSAGADVSLSDNTVTACEGVVPADGSESAGVLVTTFFGAGTAAAITGNTLIRNLSGVVIGSGADTSVVNLAFNRIVDNTFGLSSTSSTVTAENNWWGCNAGPGATGCDTAFGSGSPDFDPWLTLRLTADPSTVIAGGTTTLTADLHQNSDAADTSVLGNVPDQTPVLFADGTLGTVAPTSTSTTAGTATSTYSADSTAGSDTVSVTVDQETVTLGLTVEPAPELLIRSRIPAAGNEPVVVPVEFNSNGQDIASVAFSVDYNQACLDFDPSDGNLDGIPDAITFLSPPSFTNVVTTDLGDADGELDFLVFNVPPTEVLPDGVVVNITFTTTCTPPPGQRLLIPTPFSSDPVASFGDTAGQDVPGQSVGGSVEVLSGLRGDCNGDGFVSAGDLSACGLEVFDGDGNFWLDVIGGSFAGSPVGCDANADTVVDAGDVSCKGELIFGRPCAGQAVSADVRLSLPADLLAEVGGAVQVPVHFESDGQAISSVIFTLDFDQSLLSFDSTDSDSDGVPDAVQFHGVASNVQSVSLESEGGTGSLRFLVSDLAETPRVLLDGLLVTVTLDLLTTADELNSAVRFSRFPAASFGDVLGRSVGGRANEVLFEDGFESGDRTRWSAEVGGL